MFSSFNFNLWAQMTRILLLVLMVLIPKSVLAYTEYDTQIVHQENEITIQSSKAIDYCSKEEMETRGMYLVNNGMMPFKERGFNSSIGGYQLRACYIEEKKDYEICEKEGAIALHSRVGWISKKCFKELKLKKYLRSPQ